MESLHREFWKEIYVSSCPLCSGSFQNTLIKGALEAFKHSPEVSRTETGLWEEGKTLGLHRHPSVGLSLWVMTLLGVAYQIISILIYNSFGVAMK